MSYFDRIETMMSSASSTILALLEGFAIDVTSIVLLFQGHNRLLDVCASTSPWPVVLTVFDHLKHAGHAINTATVKLGDGEMGGVGPAHEI